MHISISLLNYTLLATDSLSDIWSIKKAEIMSAKFGSLWSGRRRRLKVKGEPAVAKVGSGILGLSFPREENR